MSSRWPAGETLHGVTALWKVYQTVPNGNTADARQFKDEFELLLKQLTLLSGLEKRLPQTQSRLEVTTNSTTPTLGSAYHDTFERLDAFIDRQKRLLMGDQHQRAVSGLQSTSGRKNKRLKPTPLVDEVEWEMELKEVGLLRRQFERYTQIAMLRLSAPTWKQPRFQFRIPSEVPLAKLKVLQATKVLIRRILAILERYLVKQSDSNDLNIRHHFPSFLFRTFLESIQQSPQSSILSWLAQPNKSTHKLNITSRFTFDSEQPIDFIHRSLQIIIYLEMRRDPSTITRSNTGSMAEPQYTVGNALRKTWNISSGSGFESLDSIYHLIVDCLDQMGFRATKFLDEARVQYTDQHRRFRSTIREWSDLSAWVSYFIMHCDVAPSPSSMGSTAPTSPSQTTRRGSTFSLPFHTYFPSSHETFPSSTGFRRPSYQWHHATNRASISTLSSIDLGTPWDIVHATLGLVRIKIPDAQVENLHSTLQCSVDIVSHPNSGEVVSIVSLREDMPGTVRHTIHENRSSNSFIPCLDNMHIHGERSERYRIHFMDVHKLEIEINRQVQTYITNPIYIFRDREDYLSFQSALLKKEVKFIADIAQIISNDKEQITVGDTIRVLQERASGRRSILFYAAYQGPNNNAGFMEWPVNAFESVKKRLGPTSIELRLSQWAFARRQRSAGNAPVEQWESRSFFFSGLDGEGDTLPELAAMTFHFYETQDRDAFREWLQD